MKAMRVGSDSSGDIGAAIARPCMSDRASSSSDVTGIEIGFLLSYALSLRDATTAWFCKVRDKRSAIANPVIRVSRICRVSYAMSLWGTAFAGAQWTTCEALEQIIAGGRKSRSMATISRGSSPRNSDQRLKSRQCSHGSVDLSFGRVDNIWHTRRTKRMCVFLDMDVAR